MYSRHKQLVNDYLKYYGGKEKDLKFEPKIKTDMDVIRENHRFLWDDETDDSNESWEQKLARKYYKKLFKEYCIVDLSKYLESKLAMRWRCEKEVINGKGQFVCGEKHCDEKESLKSWEVNFAYREQGNQLNALVKLRLCPNCSLKLNHAKPGRVESHRESRHKSKKTKKSEKPPPDESGVSQGISSEIEDNVKEKWTQVKPKEAEKTRDEEIDDFLNTLFM